MAHQLPEVMAYHATMLDPLTTTVCSCCHKVLSTEPPSDNLLPPISVCNDCEFLFFEGHHEASLRRPRPPPRRARRRRRAVQSSTESIESLFSQQFSHMITLSMQNNRPEGNPENEPRNHHSSARTTPNGSGRWRSYTTDSDGESESATSFGRPRAESDAVSFASYGGGESDASVNLTGFLDDNEFDSDADIDPMRARLALWGSESGSESESVSVSELRLPRAGEMFTSLEDDPMDYLDSRGLEEFLMQLIEDDGSRRGAPPALASFVEALPRIAVGERERHEVCAICKDLLAVEATLLPCSHLYHPFCIEPWLATRNSCPLCRYELPTDDPDYEDGKLRRQQRQRVSPAVVAGDGNREEGGPVGEEDSGGGGGGRWLFLAAAPIVGLVGIVLVLWLGNRGVLRNSVPVDRGSSSLGSRRRESRSRRWWSFF